MDIYVTLPAEMHVASPFCGELFDLNFKCTKIIKFPKPCSGSMGNHKISNFQLPLTVFCKIFVLGLLSSFFLCSDKQKNRVVKKHTYQINHTVEPQGEQKDAKRYPSINTPLLMYYTVPEIALPACDRNERWQVISDCSVQEILINGKCFKSSANIYLVHLEKLDLTSNEKVNMMTSKCGKNCYFNLTIMQLNQDTDTRLHLFVLIALVIHKSYARKYTYR